MSNGILFDSRAFEALGDDYLALHPTLKTAVLRGQAFLQDHVQEGSLATFYIGSDAYGKRVGKVHRYKSGSKVGLIRAIETKDGRVFTLRANGQLIQVGKDYGELVLGYFEDYQDPNF